MKRNKIERILKPEMEYTVQNRAVCFLPVIGFQEDLRTKGIVVEMRDAKIPFIRIHLFNRFFRMTTAGNTERKIGTVMMGSRGYLSSKNKSITGIDRGMFLQTIVRLTILDRPVGFQLPGEIKRLAVLIQLYFRCLLLQFGLLKFVSVLLENKFKNPPPIPLAYGVK